MGSGVGAFTFYLYTYVISIFAADVFALVIKNEIINFFIIPEEYGVDRFKAYKVWWTL